MLYSWKKREEEHVTHHQDPTRGHDDGLIAISCQGIANYRESSAACDASFTALVGIDQG